MNFLKLCSVFISSACLCQPFHYNVPICGDTGTYISFTTFNDGQSKYFWQANGATTDGNYVSVFVDGYNAQPVVLTQAYSSGCSISTAVTVTGVSCDVIYFMNSFTPGMDGLNETFYPKYSGDVLIGRLIIFDRGGIEIYEGNSAWYGTFYSEFDCPLGVYTYKCEYYLSGVYKEKFGKVLLIR